MNNSVAEYACVDIQCIGNNAINSTDTEINRSIYERLQIQEQNKHAKQASKSSTNTTSNNTTSTKGKMAQQHPSRHPPSYNLGNYFPRVSSEPTSRKNYQTSSRERDLKVGTLFQFNLNFSIVIIFLCLFYFNHKKYFDG